MNYKKVIEEKGIQIPPAPKPAGSYLPCAVYHGIAFLSGQISRTAAGAIITGRVGAELTLEEGIAAARAAALNVISIIENTIGFQKFDRFLKVVGYVQTSPDFHRIPDVVNGASDLFVEIFGEKGGHARSAVGAHTLPLNAAVEIEATLAIAP